MRDFVTERERERGTERERDNETGSPVFSENGKPSALLRRHIQSNITQRNKTKEGVNILCFLFSIING